MSYQTIVVHVDHSVHADARIRYAAQLAERCGAHLVGSAFSGISRYVEAGVEVILAQQAELRAHNEAALARFDTIAAAEGVPSHERRYTNDDPAGGLVLQARYADLVVLSQTDPDDPAAAHLAGPLPAQVVMGGGRPVLVLPYAGQFATLARRPLVAWDGSLEATRAVAGALPLLRAAGTLDIVLFQPSGAAGRDPGADLALYLARHGVQCTVHAEPLSINGGVALLSLAADLQTDLLVMGAYGNARLREMLLGGVTETILDSMTAPVLMAH
ncbi:universal stress protein [Massilia sp. S19_KUP03_FR1]|uniref:universal stress protein n=1 Tax=Massilia sp. S19_KUP03_FR1 TaxID=3025503 RepID=UPI002FCD7CF9